MENRAENKTGTEGLPFAARMRSAYNRAGFGMLAEMGAASVVGNGIVVAVYAAIYAKLIPMLTRLVEQAAKSDIKSVFGETVSKAGDLLQSSGLMVWLLAALVIGTGIGMAVGMLLFKRIARNTVPIEKKTLTPKAFLLLIPVAFGLWGIGVLLGNYTAFFDLKTVGLEQMIAQAGKGALAYYIYAIAGAPILEEILYRKLLIDRLHAYGQWTAAALSALVFGLVHGNSGQFFLAFLIGLLFAVVYMKTGRVIYTVILHVIINASATAPEIAALYGADIHLATMIVLHALMVAGIVLIIVKRKSIPVLLNRTADADARVDTPRVSFKTPGIRLMTLFMLVTLVAMDLFTMISGVIVNESALPLLSIFATVLTVFVTLYLPKLFKKKPVAVKASEIAE